MNVSLTPELEQFIAQEVKDGGIYHTADDVIRAALEAWNANDLDAWLGAAHPAIVFHTSGVFPDFDPVYRGHEGMTEFWRAMHEPWDELRFASLCGKGDSLSLLGRKERPQLAAAPPGHQELRTMPGAGGHRAGTGRRCPA